jgi:serine/threonine-protein kinase
VVPGVGDNRESYLRIIENQAKIADRFRNIRRLDPNGGKGNFSLMFTAYDEITREEIVLKFFHPKDDINLDRVERFQREGEILKRLRGQPNILECIDGVCRLPVSLTYVPDIQITQNFSFIPMKKASGSVEQLIYSGGASPEKCLVYFREMCKGVARIHSQSISHRDLRPPNFLIFPGDDVRLGDFGTAKYMDGSMPDIRTKYEVPVGDWYYSSPEHFCQIGISNEVAFPADIFSLGAILFEMFTKEVLTEYLYNQDFLGNLIRLNNMLSGLPQKDRVKYYSGTIDILGASTSFPDIFLFNDFVPNSIKDHLNFLYKDLTKINFQKRLYQFTSIYRRLEICLLTIRNEEKYRKWLKKKKEIRKIRLEN